MSYRNQTVYGKAVYFFSAPTLLVRESGNSSDKGYPNHGVIVKLSINAFIKALYPSKSLRLYTLKNQYISISKN